MACPICNRPAATQVKPFCSKRCADIDLGKWLSVSYAIASDDPDDAQQVIDDLSATQIKPH
jgi:hypothetical protein